MPRSRDSDGSGASFEGRSVTCSTDWPHLGHRSKGLEFNRVFVASVLDRIIPSARAADTAEERRLMYVAMTRAKHELAISVPRGEPRPSPFVAEAGINISVVAQGDSHA